MVLHIKSLAGQKNKRRCLLLVTVLLTVTLWGVSQGVRAYDINGFTFSGDIRTGWVQYDLSLIHI